MDNSITCGFSEFEYISIINEAIGAGYKLVPIKDAFLHNKKHILMRHDIDFSIEHALEIAKIENKLGVCSTYFFMITCEFYNLFSAPSREMIIEIQSLGHEIGLHWDSRFLPKDENLHKSFFKSQLTILETIVNSPILSASQHVPTDTPVFDIGPYIKNNPYSKKYNDSYKYVSDSSMTWREFTPIDFINKGDNFQFLSHPIWWVAKGENQEEKLNYSITQAFSAMKNEVSIFHDYMQKVLADRAKYDKFFEDKVTKNK